MTRILLLSDTHSYWDDRYAKYAAECDEIWHVGDIGTPEVTDKLASAQFVAVKDGDVLIKNGKAGSVVEVYSADGLSVGRYAVSADGSLKISLTNLPKGVYLIKTNLATIKVIR